MIALGYSSYNLYFSSKVDIITQMTVEKLSTRIPDDNLDSKLLKSFVTMIEGFRHPTNPEETAYADQWFDAAERVISQMEQLEENQHAARTGGIMVVVGTDGDGWVAIREIGEISDGAGRLARDKRHKYIYFALAKAAFLLMYPEFSASSENEKIGKGGQLTYYDGTVIPAGAMIVDDNHLVAFSSFTPQDDESMILATAVEAAHLSLPTALENSRALGNDRFPKIANRVLGLA